jgi:hypothetical protein
MKVKPPIWTFDEEDRIKVLQSTRHELAAVESAARVDGDCIVTDDDRNSAGPTPHREGS